MVSFFSRSPPTIPLRLAWDECERVDDTHPTNAKGEEGCDGGNEQSMVFYLQMCKTPSGGIWHIYTVGTPVSAR
jgi:hypothetical protein